MSSNLAPYNARGPTQRKRIEVASVRDFQHTLAQGITPSLLEWKGIEATATRATSREYQGRGNRQQ